MFAPTQRAMITLSDDPIAICCDTSSCAPVRALGVCFGACGIGKRRQSALLFDGGERVLGVGCSF